MPVAERNAKGKEEEFEVLTLDAIYPKNRSDHFQLQPEHSLRA